MRRFLSKDSADTLGPQVMELAKRHGFKLRRGRQGRQTWTAVRRFEWREERVVVVRRFARDFDLTYEVDLLFGPKDTESLATINAAWHLLGKRLEVPVLPVLSGRFVRKTLDEIETSLAWFDRFATPGRCRSYLEAGLGDAGKGSPAFQRLIRFLRGLPGDQRRVDMPSDQREGGDTNYSLLFEQMLHGEFGPCFFPGVKDQRRKLAILSGWVKPFRKVQVLGLPREKGFDYWVTAKGTVVRQARSASNKSRPQLVRRLDTPLEPGVVYFLDLDGDLARST